VAIEEDVNVLLNIYWTEHGRVGSVIENMDLSRSHPLQFCRPALGIGDKGIVLCEVCPLIDSETGSKAFESRQAGCNVPIIVKNRDVIPLLEIRGKPSEVI
jgi:hypothetical protein